MAASKRVAAHSPVVEGPEGSEVEEEPCVHPAASANGGGRRRQAPVAAVATGGGGSSRGGSVEGRRRRAAQGGRRCVVSVSNHEQAAGFDLLMVIISVAEGRGRTEEREREHDVRVHVLRGDAARGAAAGWSVLGQLALMDADAGNGNVMTERDRVAGVAGIAVARSGGGERGRYLAHPFARSLLHSCTTSKLP